MQAYHTIRLPSPFNHNGVKQFISDLRDQTGKDNVIELISYIDPDDLRDDRNDIAQAFREEVAIFNLDNIIKPRNIYELNSLCHLFVNLKLENIKLIGIQEIEKMINTDAELWIAFMLLPTDDFLTLVEYERISKIFIMLDDNFRFEKILDTLYDKTEPTLINNLIPRLGGIEKISDNIENATELNNIFKLLLRSQNGQDEINTLIKKLGFIRLSKLIKNVTDLKKIFYYLNYDQMAGCLEIMRDTIISFIPNFTVLCSVLRYLRRPIEFIRALSYETIAVLPCTYDNLKDFLFNYLDEEKRSDYLSLLGAKKTTALIKTYSQLTIFLNLLEGIRSFEKKSLPSQEDYFKEIAVDTIAATIENKDQLLEFLAYLTPDQQHICLQTVTNLDNTHPLFNTLPALIMELPIDLLGDFLQILAKKPNFTVPTSEILYHISSDSQRLNILFKTIGTPNIETFLEVYQKLTSVEVKQSLLMQLYSFLITDQEKHEALCLQLPQEKELLKALRKNEVLVWNYNERSKILSDPQHPFHKEWNTSDLFENLENLFSLSISTIRHLPSEIESRIRDKILTTTKPEEIKPLLTFLQNELRSIDERTISPQRISAGLRFFVSEVLSETSDIALRLQFAIEKLQALFLKPAQTLAEENKEPQVARLSA